MLLNDTLNVPFYEGGELAVDVPYYLPVSLGARSYLIDVPKYQRQTVPAQRAAADQSSEPGEQTLNPEALWKRSASTFHHGAGQEFFDDDDSDRLRFFTSKGIDVFAKRKISLLNTTEEKRTTTNTNLAIITVGSRIYIADGNSVVFTGTPTAASWSVTDAQIQAGEAAQSVRSITTDGATVWAALGTNGIHQTVAGATTSTHLSTGDCFLVGYANGRLLGVNNDLIFEVSRTGTRTTVMDHPNPDFDWTVIASAPNAIYMAGTCVDRSEIYAAGALNAAGALSTPILAATLPDGETIQAMCSYGGAMLLGTSRGLRLAQIGANHALHFGPVIEIAGGVAALEPQGEFVWFSWTNYDSTSTGLGRADLSTFTEALVPAYASDLMTTGQGTVQGVCSFGGRRYYSVAGDGFYGEAGTKVASGTYDSGWIRYGTLEKKIVTAVDLRHESLPAGAKVSASIIKEDGTTSSIGDSATASTLGPISPLGAEITATEAVRLSLTLTRATDPTTGPVLRRWTLHSRVAPLLTDEIVVPIVMKTAIRNPVGDGEVVWYDPLEEFQYFQQLVNNRTVVKYVEGGAGYDVYVSQVRVAPEAWTRDRTFFEGLIYLRLLTIKLT